MSFDESKVIERTTLLQQYQGKIKNTKILCYQTSLQNDALTRQRTARKSFEPRLPVSAVAHMGHIDFLVATYNLRSLATYNLGIASYNLVTTCDRIL